LNDDEKRGPKEINTLIVEFTSRGSTATFIAKKKEKKGEGKKLTEKEEGRERERERERETKEREV